MMLRQLGGIGLLAVALALPGCTRTVLNYDKSFKLDPGAEQTATSDAINKDQKIKVDLSATGSKVDVYVFLEKDKDVAQDAVKAWVWIRGPAGFFSPAPERFEGEDAVIQVAALAVDLPLKDIYARVRMD